MPNPISTQHDCTLIRSGYAPPCPVWQNTLNICPTLPMQYEALKKQQAEALSAQQATAGKQPLAPIPVADRKSAAATRIGFSQ